MDSKQIGAWLIHHTNKLNSIENNYSLEYDDIQTAGKAGLLLSSLSASEEQTISIDNARKLARIANIGKLELDSLLKILKECQLIDIDTSYKEIAVLGLTNHSILQHTTDIFRRDGEKELQEAAIQLAEDVSISPKLEKEISQKISDQYHLSEAQTENLFKDSKSFGFVDYEHIDSSNNLIFNGNLFKRDTIEKSTKILSTLNVEEAAKINELNSKLDTYGCIHHDEATQILGDKLYEKVISIGLFDISFISNESGRIGFITKPSAFQKFGSNSMLDDTFDLAKAFISSITYGMKNSTYARGRINNVEALLKKLIGGGTVGPVEAIGQDYKLLELRGVVKITPTINYNQEVFSMKLLKKEIGELALNILTTGSANEYSLNLPNITGSMNNFEAPEQHRVTTRKKQVELNPQITHDILLSLRTGGV
ncbi:hypothetical protein [Rodentibacter myodis]|uniref:Uncharacterized protein n=1 Tax=Rodentibacter myodis TaxID=1907939 RepID=A0A1V3JMJ0_9PAST|nr:hypothetical protein [Rodentibacter myodis]OOF58046.1 hypothetical protein BKL49_08140 [Rodentibacter myodis]